jgi:hypothetical protein
MMSVVLESGGRLVGFEAVPPRVLAPGARDYPVPDWRPLFAAAASTSAH